MSSRRPIIDQAEVIVIGLGGVGAFALRALSQIGVDALGLERFAPGHDRGSSHGGTRVFRHAYFEHPDYVPLLRFSSDDFGHLEASRGTALLQRCGCLLLGPHDGAMIEGAADAASQHGLAVERLGVEMLRRRYPQFALPRGWVGLYEADAGFVRPEAAIRAALDEAVDRGARLRIEQSAAAWRETEGGVEVETAAGLLRCDRLVVAAGAWTGALLPALRAQLRVTRQIQTWVEADDPESIDCRDLPAWVLAREEGPALYGIPADPLAPGKPRMKLGLHGRDDPVDPDRVPRSVGRAELEELESLRARWLPRLSGPIRAAKVCLYTSSPDAQLIVDRLPGSRRVVLGAGLSGHGFKLCPALGRILAELAIRGRSPLPADFLGLSRFG